MTLSELFVFSAVLADVGPTGRDDVIRLLLDGMADAGHVSPDDMPVLLRTVLGRERLGSTGIGNGLAMPHGRHSRLARPVGGLAIVKQGVDFDSVDREPVYVVLLCLTAPRAPWVHLGRATLPVFETLTRSLRGDRFVRQLREAEAVDDVARALRAADEGAFEHGDWRVRR